MTWQFVVAPLRSGYQSFKLKDKQREGTKVRKTYRPPATPYSDEATRSEILIDVDHPRKITENIIELQTASALSRIRRTVVRYWRSVVRKLIRPDHK